MAIPFGFSGWIRFARWFDGIDSLIAQLQSDERIARSWTDYRNS